MVRKANQYAGIYKSQHPISKGQSNAKWCDFVRKTA